MAGDDGRRPPRGQSAIDRLQSSAYELVLDGQSYSKRQKPTAGAPTERSRRRRRP